MDITTKIIGLFGDDGKNVNIQFDKGGWRAAYNDGVFQTFAVSENLRDCCEALYMQYCDFYSPKRIAEELFKLIERIETNCANDIGFGEESLESICQKRNNFIAKVDGEFVWKSVNPNFKETLYPKNEVKKPAAQKRQEPAEVQPQVTEAPVQPRHSAAMPSITPQDSSVHATDGYPDYFMKRTTDYLYTDCYGLMKDGSRILVKINRFDYSCTEIVPNVKNIPPKDEMEPIAKDEFESYYREADNLIRNRKFYTPIDYNNVETVKD